MSELWNAEERRHHNLAALRAVAFRRGITLPAPVVAADARVGELEAIVSTPDVELPHADAVGDVGKTVAALASQRTTLAAQRAVAEDLLPSARQAVDDRLAEMLPVVIDTMVDDFARHLDVVRRTVGLVPQGAPAQLATVQQFEAHGELTGAIAQLEGIVSDRRDLCSLTGDPAAATGDLRRWGNVPALCAVLSPPPREIVAAFSPLSLELAGLSSCDPVQRWRRLVRLERAGTLRLSLARAGEARRRCVIANSWHTARFAAQSIYGAAERDRALEEGERAWRSLQVAASATAASPKRPGRPKAVAANGSAA